jgi:PIF1-like helicase/Helitron helicase-like domain at N-terminus/Helicase
MLLKRLLDGSEPRSSQFRTNIRRYNSAFAFTSFMYGKDERLDGRRGFHAFQIHGEVYHWMGPIGPAAADAPPRFAQLYFYDPQQSSEYRSLHHGLDPILTRELGAMVEEHNPFVRQFVSAHDTIQQHQGPADLILNPQLQVVLQAGSDKRRYNLPAAGDVAAILPDERADPSFRDVLLYHRREAGSVSDHRTKISRTHPAYLPLHYVLLFPFGTPGWHWNMTYQGDHAAGPEHGEPDVMDALFRDLEQGDNLDDGDEVEAHDGGQRGSRRLTQRPWYRYYLFDRGDEFPTILRAGRLFEQFVDDAWASIDDETLEWHRHHQDTIRAELYRGVMDAMARDFEASQIGQPVILPSSYLHGDRFMSKCYQNSIAIMRVFGSPALFITFTANPKWPEVLEQCWPGMPATHRHDVVVRVYKLKLDALLREIKGITTRGPRLRDGGIFGDCVGDVYTIEYQKRGLPHAHILVFLRDSDRPLTPEAVDEIVCAELPQPEDDPDGELFDIVTSCMVHGPCGTMYPNERCMEQAEPGKPKQCVKRFPKPFQDRTCIREDGYPTYRRRQGGRMFAKRINGQDVELDCRWVVPYNPYLTRRYKAHVNVEICGSVKAIKYIHKYIYKGADRATIRIEDRYDEVTKTLNGRYITPAMAIWNIMAFRCHEEKPPVMQLPYHLEGCHMVHFAAGLSMPQLEMAAGQQKSMFIAWMEYNRSHDEGNLDLRYQDFPMAFRWDKPGRRWMKRKRNTPAIGRLDAANPNQGEYFELWRLLQRRRGAKSYEDLYTVNGVRCTKPSDACAALGLNFGDDEWQQFFEEVRHASTGHNMRTLFVTACVQGSVRNGRQLWDDFKDAMSDDLPRRAERRRIVNLPPDLEHPYHDYALFLLRRMFQEFGETLDHFDLPSPVFAWEVEDANPLLAQERYDHLEQQLYVDDNLPQLNAGQQAAYDQIVHAIERDPQSAHFFLQGPAGTGKTFLYKTLCAFYRAQGKVVLCVASSGIAAQLLPGGRTSHSRFKIPLSVTAMSKCHIPKQSQLAELLRNTRLIIWDEVPMQHKHCFTAVHRSLCDVLDQPDDGPLFGGIPAVLGGDFAQTLPVVRKGSRADIVAANLQRCQVWDKLRLLRLTQNMRVQRTDENQRYANWIGSMSYERTRYGNIDLPPEVDVMNSQEAFLDHIYPLHEIQRVDERTTFFRGRAILCTRNDTATKLNNTILQSLGGPQAEEKVYESADRVEDDDQGLGLELPPAYLATLSPSGIPPASLRLRKGTPVMLLRNLYAQNGLCNGTRLIVTQMLQRGVVARIDGGDYDGDVHFIPRIDCSTTEGDLPFKLFRRQLPLRLCFAMTINKSQGQTLHTVGVDLRSPAFSHGQLYVALSRVTDVRRLKVLLPEGQTRKTINEVYDEVLIR